MNENELKTLLEVAEKAARLKDGPFDAARSAALLSFGHTFGDPATCVTLLKEIARLRIEIADYEETNLVPRSRWEATNNDWLEMRRQYHELAQKATAEIERLEAKNKQP